MIEDRGVSIPLMYPPLTPRIEEGFRDGWYEEAIHTFVLETLRADHVVLEFGTGLGFVAALTSKIAATVHTYEANPELEGYLHTIFKANGVAMKPNPVPNSRTTWSARRVSRTNAWGPSSYQPSRNAASIRAFSGG